MFGQLLSFVILFLVQVNQMQLLYNGKCSSWMSSHPVRVVPITCSREAILLNLTLVIQRQIIIIKRELSFLPSINKMFQAVSYTEWKQLTLISNFFFFHVCCIFWKKSLLQHRPDCNSFKAWLVLNLLMSLLQFVMVDCSSWSNQAQVALSLLPQGVPLWGVKSSGVRQSKFL